MSIGFLATALIFLGLVACTESTPSFSPARPTPQGKDTLTDTLNDIRDFADLFDRGVRTNNDLLNDPALTSVTSEFGPTVIHLKNLPSTSELAIADVKPWSSWWYPKKMALDRDRDRAEKKALEEERLQHLKETWARQETEVEEKMKLFCQQLSIEYVDKEKFPFGGKPDNVVKICGEYIVFDGKSPQGTELDNFPTYIRTQAEAAKKYIKSEEVKKDVYLVVPTNAIEVVKETFIQLGTHRIHVVTIDALIPILIHLKKVEEYEFADKLSPEDREKIVTNQPPTDSRIETLSSNDNPGAK